MLAFLYASGPQKSFPIGRSGAEPEYKEAIAAIVSDRRAVPADLQVRVYNDYAVFLLEQGRALEAEDLLAGIRDEADRVAETDKPLFCRYLYNLGRAFLEQGKHDQALGEFVRAYAVDPYFLPAAEAALDTAELLPPTPGIRAVESLTATALEAGDFVQAEENLHRALARPEWNRDDAFPTLIDHLALYFAETSLTSAAFAESWEKEVRAVAAAAPSLAPRLALILDIYNGTVPSCDDPDQIYRAHRAWTNSASSRALSRLLKTTADERFREGDETGAALHYKLSLCFDPRNEESEKYYANLLEYSPAQRQRFLDQVASTHESVLEAVGRGFEKIGNPTLAAEVFQATGVKLAKSNEPDEAGRYFDLVKAQALPPEEMAKLVEDQKEIIKEALRHSETVQARFAGKTRINLPTGYRQTPIPPEPWQVASAVVPGVLAEETTYAAAKSGQRETLVLPGSNPSGGQYSVDGVAVGALSESPGPPTYYSLDAIEEIEVALSGADLDQPMLGGGVNLITKWPEDNETTVAVSHTTMPRELQKKREISASNLAPGQERTDTNSIEKQNETTVEIGGRIYKERFQGWLFYSDTESTIGAIGGDAEDLGLATGVAKLLGNLGRSDLVRLSYSRGERDEKGAGASLLRSPETTWLHTGTSDLLKVEYDHVGKEWQISAHYAASSNELSFVPRQRSGGAYLAPDGLWKQSYSSLDSRPSVDQWEARMSRGFRNKFFTRFDQNLELGARSRSLDFFTKSTFGSDNTAILARENLGSGFDIARLYRSGTAEAELNHHVLWMQDTFSFDQLTLGFGLRYDQQSGENTAARAPANPLAPELVPGVDSGRRGAIDWGLLSTKLGLTYSFRSNNLLLQANYSRFGSELDGRHLLRTNPAFQSYGQFAFEDNGDGRLDRNEIASLVPLAPNGFDPAAPNGSPHQNDPDLRPEVTDELALELRTHPSRDFQLGLAATFRLVSDLLELRDLVRDESGTVRTVERSDFSFDRRERVTLPGGEVREIPVYELRPGVAFTGGSLLTNGDREQTYIGLRLAFAGPLRGNGQFRGHLSYDDWRWRIGSASKSFEDPTDTVQSNFPSGVSRSDNDGDVVAPQAFRAEADALLLNSRWAFHLSFSQPLPFLGLALGASLNMREGFPVARYVTVVPGDGLPRDVQVDAKTDSQRFENLILLDLRLEKQIDLKRVHAAFSLDGFNLLDRDTPLWRVRQVNSPRADFLTRTVNPRAFRLGLNLSLR